MTQAGSTAYTYDANGSMLTGGGRSIAHTVFNKPSTITKSAPGEDDREVLIHYGPNRDRYRRIDRVKPSGAMVSEQTTHYAGSVERIWRPDGTVDTKRYLDGELIVTRTERSGTVTETERYLFKDHLGSTDLITDRSGAIEGAMSFDAFGLRRPADSFASLPEADRTGFDTSVTTRGFTGHEGLDAVGLVHMNGRVYDPLLGRFISADPYIPAPHLTQSYNPYSYAMNNPTSYVDPDGFFFKKLLRVVVTIVVHAEFGFWTALIVNSILQSAIELLPEAGRVYQAFDYGLPAAPSVLGGPTGSIPGRLCAAANCLDAPAEVQAALGATVSADHPGLPNGAITTAYLAAVTGSPDNQAASRPSRIGQAWLIEHPLAAEIAVAFIPYGCAYTDEGCSTTDIVLDTIGFIPILKPATAAIKIFKGASRVRTRTRAASCSFAAGTPVATPMGPRAIEDIQTGDWVLAKDEETGRVEPKRVSLAYGSVHDDAVLLTVRQRDGGEEAILTTSEHPFQVSGEGWVPAGLLAVGDELLVLSGQAASLEAIGFPSEPLTAYNFEVEEFHTYAVGEHAIWVHNACNFKHPPDKPAAFPKLILVKRKSGVRGGGSKRKRWQDRDGNLYEWDGRHGTLEKYNRRGEHLGEFDPDTGDKLKARVPGRRIEP